MYKLFTMWNYWGEVGIEVSSYYRGHWGEILLQRALGQKSYYRGHLGEILLQSALR